MKKEIIRSTVHLLTLSLIAKILSFFVRIACARILSAEAMNYYSLTTVSYTHLDVYKRQVLIA